MRYGAVTAVDNINFTIEAGKLVTLLGPSGCGKTTTLRMIAGLEIASDGQILIGGKDVTKLSAADRDVSMVFQSYALFPHMSVLDNAAYGPTVKGVGKDEAKQMALEKLALVGLKGFENRYPSELSGGQQQRVAVARALVLEPQVLLFDEPLSNLDAKLRRRVREEIRELQQDLNLTVAYVTHDQEEALAVSDRIIVMSNARIAQEGAPPRRRGAGSGHGRVSLTAGEIRHVLPLCHMSVTMSIYFTALVHQSSVGNGWSIRSRWQMRALRAWSRFSCSDIEPQSRSAAR